jgi:hypothetical protein
VIVGLIPKRKSAFHPDDIQRIQRAVNCLHPACELKSLQALHTDIVEHHRLIYQYFTQLKSLGDEFASRFNVMKTLELLLRNIMKLRNESLDILLN